jgi:hypothetical protein
MHLVEISRLERGLRDMRVSTIAKVARGLAVPAERLMRKVR